ncbi:MAG TPA: helix-turn-helix domain-containing protein [Pseudonocardiaceae bacterium]|nr:helix-turn-helix domain-containing protein [Pseudonocardiaceae bacterium]
MNSNVIPLDAVRFDPDEPISLNDLPGAETYTVLEVAARLGIGRCMAYDLVRQGVIPAKRLGRRWIVPRARFNAWLNDQSQGA